MAITATYIGPQINVQPYSYPQSPICPTSNGGLKTGSVLTDPSNLKKFGSQLVEEWLVCESRRVELDTMTSGGVRAEAQWCREAQRIAVSGARGDRVRAA
jgi:hypothetical protein